MKPCPECNSDKVYRYKEYVDAEGPYGPSLLPRLASGIFSVSKFIPVVCVECGYLKLYASEEAISKIQTSKHWMKI